MFFLKYFDNSLTSFCDLAEIGGGIEEMKVSFTISLPLLLFVDLGTCVLWQPLDQCPIAAQTINLKGRYLVRNISCVIHKRTQQGTTTVFY